MVLLSHRSDVESEGAGGWSNGGWYVDLLGRSSVAGRRDRNRRVRRLDGLRPLLLRRAWSDSETHTTTKCSTR